MLKESVDIEPLQSEFPVPHDNIVLFDLDQTLIDESYSFTDLNINDRISNLQDQGWTVGLSSDTPLLALRDWATTLGVNGPIIAERGAVVEVERIITNNEDFQAYKNSRENIEAKLLEIGVNLWHGDATKAIRDRLKMGSEGNIFVLINTLRTNSISMFIREVRGEGTLAINNDLTETIVNQVRTCYPDFPDLYEDLNHEYGLLILSRHNVTKRAGTEILMTEKKLTEVGMVGNSMTDFVGRDIAVHYAVANSTPEFKNQSDYIAREPYTSGVIEVIDKLVVT